MRRPSCSSSFTHVSDSKSHASAADNRQPRATRPTPRCTTSKDLRPVDLSPHEARPRGRRTMRRRHHVLVVCQSHGLPSLAHVCTAGAHVESELGARNRTAPVWPGKKRRVQRVAPLRCRGRDREQQVDVADQSGGGGLPRKEERDRPAPAGRGSRGCRSLPGIATWRGAGRPPPVAPGTGPAPGASPARPESHTVEAMELDVLEGGWAPVTADQEPSGQCHRSGGQTL